MSNQLSATKSKGRRSATAKSADRVSASRKATRSAARPATRAKRDRSPKKVIEAAPPPPPPPPPKPNGDLLRDDPALDRRIIEGMLHDRQKLLDELAKEGVRPAQVMRRAADLGLSDAYIRQVQGVAADLAGERPGGRRTPNALGARTCLSCDRVFLSSGPGNRLCMRCRGGDAGLAQL